jgi:hypothetical protein
MTPKSSFAVAALLAAGALAAVAKASPADNDSGLALLAPPDRAEIRFPNPARATLTFAWRATPAAGGHRIVIARKHDLTGLVVKRTERDSSSVAVMGLAEGTYYWRVERLAGDGTRAQVSKTARFSIVAGAP